MIDLFNILAQNVIDTPIPPSMTNWDIVKLVTPIVATLLAAVKAMATMIKNNMVKAEAREEALSNKLQVCDARHLERDAVTIAMVDKVGRLEAKMEGHQEARRDVKEGLQDLSNKVLEMLHKEN